MSTGPLGFRSGDFWSDTAKTRDEVHQRLIDEDFIGLIIDAPTQVNIDERQTLPVIGWRSAAMWQAQRTNFQKFALITALQVRTGRLLANRAQVQRNFSEVIPDDDGDPGEGMILSEFDLDLRERLPDLPWEQDRYLLTVILQEQISNRLAVDLVSARGRVSGRLDERPTQTLIPPPGDPLPSYRVQRDSLPLPKKAGIDLFSERGPITTDARCVIRGSYRLPLLRQHLLSLRTSILTEGCEESDLEAVVPLTLLLTGSEAPGPFLIPMHVPSYNNLDSDSLVPQVTGTFALDLFETEALRHREPQVYYLYAFSGEIMGGPHRFEVLT
jgi:hypothetical protein